MKRCRQIIPPLLFGIVLVIVWQCGLLHLLFQVTPIQLPYPAQILSAFWGHIDGIGEDALTTVGPALLGLLSGVVIGYLVAIIVTAFPAGAYGLMIYVAVINAIPIIALAPLMNRWFTIPFITKYVVILVAASASMALNAAQGLKNIDTSLLSLMHSCGATKLETYIKLRIPNSLPSVFSGLKIGVSAAMLATIISEFFSKETSGLGYMIKHSLKVGNQKPLGWAYVLAMSLFSMLLYGIVCATEKKFIRWHVSQR